MRKVLIWRKSAYYEKWRISHPRYTRDFLNTVHPPICHIFISQKSVDKSGKWGISCGLNFLVKVQMVENISWFSKLTKNWKKREAPFKMYQISRKRVTSIVIFQWRRSLGLFEKTKSIKKFETRLALDFSVKFEGVPAVGRIKFSTTQKKFAKGAKWGKCQLADKN